jgi:magnesium transporter
VSAQLALARAYAEGHPTEVARLLESVPDTERAALLVALDEPVAARVLATTTPRFAAEALARLPRDDAARITAALDPRAAAILLARLPAEDTAALLALLPQACRTQLRTLLEYGPSRAGGRVDPRALSVPESLSAAEALSWLLRERHGAINYVYVLDDAQRLTGVLNLRELMSAPGDVRVEAIMVRDPDRLEAEDTLERVARHPGWRRVHALPVVDASGRFLGALRYSAFRAVESELGQAASGPDPARSASALAELYGLSASAFMHWASAVLRPQPLPPKDGGR